MFWAGEQLRGGNLPLFQLQPRQAQGFGRRPLGNKRLLQCHGVVPDGMESIRDILKCSRKTVSRYCAATWSKWLSPPAAFAAR